MPGGASRCWERESPSDRGRGAVLKHLLCSRFCTRSSTCKVSNDPNNPAEKVKPPFGS